MTPVKGGYAVDVPVINVSERARREHATVWSTFKAFGVTLSRLFTSLFKRDMPTISYPEQTPALFRTISRNAHSHGAQRRKPEVRGLLHVRDDLPGRMHLHRSRRASESGD